MIEFYSVSALSRIATAAGFLLIICIFALILKIYRREFDSERKHIIAQATQAGANWARALDERKAVINQKDKKINELQAQIDELGRKLENANKTLDAFKVGDLK